MCDDCIQALQNSEDAQETCKGYYDRSHRDGPALKPGDLAWIRRQQPSPNDTSKLRPKYKEIYKIIARPTSVTLRVQQIPGVGNRRVNSSEQTVHCSQVKPYKPPFADLHLFSQVRTPSAQFPTDFEHPASANRESRSSTLNRQLLAETFAALAKLRASPAIGQTGRTPSRVPETAHSATRVTDTTSSQTDLAITFAGV